MEAPGTAPLAETEHQVQHGILRGMSKISAILEDLKDAGVMVASVFSI